MKGLTEVRLRRLLREGLGQGKGAGYTPWLTASRVSSEGFASSITGRITGRRHQVLSRIEKGVLLLMDRRRDVVDIREQFPLLPVECTTLIARQLQLRPVGAGGSIHVMTTDFLIDFKCGRQLAVAVKPLSRIRESQRVREILAIERAYWAARSVQFQVITDNDVTEAMMFNLETLHAARRGAITFGPDEVQYAAERLLVRLGSPPIASLSQACRLVDDESNQPRGSHLAVLKQLLWSGALSLNLRARFCPISRYAICGGALLSLEEAY